MPGQTVPLFELKQPVFEGMDFVVKRTFDIAGAAMLLLVLSPLLAGIALTVKVTSRGPVLFRSRRPGIGGQPFDCLKFRTMHTDAERRQAELERANEAMRSAVFSGFEQIRAPVTLAWGERDRLVARPRTTVPGWRSVTLHGCGHIPTWDNPSQVARVLLLASA